MTPPEVLSNSLRGPLNKPVACDIDPVVLAATRSNAELNSVQLDYLDDFSQLGEKVDILLAADILYDPDNLPRVRVFRESSRQVRVADSRVKFFSGRGLRNSR